MSRGKARLSSLPQLVAALPPRVGYTPGNQAARSAHRLATDPAQALYSSSRWQKMRWQAKVEGNFTCVMCGRTSGKDGELHVDHIEPHRGNQVRFWDRSNLQVLCAECHNSKKQREELTRR